MFSVSISFSRSRSIEVTASWYFVYKTNDRKSKTTLFSFCNLVASKFVGNGIYRYTKYSEHADYVKIQRKIRNRVFFCFERGKLNKNQWPVDFFCYIIIIIIVVAVHFVVFFLLECEQQVCKQNHHHRRRHHRHYHHFFSLTHPRIANVCAIDLPKWKMKTTTITTTMDRNMPNEIKKSTIEQSRARFYPPAHIIHKQIHTGTWHECVCVYVTNFTLQTHFKINQIPCCCCFHCFFSVVIVVVVVTVFFLNSVYSW